jgi:hypothetical protein
MLKGFSNFLPFSRSFLITMIAESFPAITAFSISGESRALSPISRVPVEFLLPKLGLCDEDGPEYPITF